LGERCPASDRQRIAARFWVGKKQVKLADVTVARLTGYPDGRVPPFGDTTPLPGLLDAAVWGWEAVQGGGRVDHTLLRIAPAGWRGDENKMDRG
jgi:prolyl-tRNA editing enzyme YbaK/EbsC (Cys-tRNA(Pro) deacylase)